MRRRTTCFGISSIIAFLVLTLVVPAGAATIFVDASATGANNGSSWADAFVDLQSGLGAAVATDEIWVAAGTYRPTSGTSRSATFQLITGVAVYGGFDGTETLLSQRDWIANVTILSGDIGVGGVSTDNSYHVVTGSGTGSSAILDGFKVTGGRADVLPDHTGGGMYNSGGNPTIRNVLISDCYAAHSGGGMRNDSSSPDLFFVTFLNNYSDTRGGGMYNYRDSNPSLIICTFADNSAYESGGGMYNDDSNPSLVQVVFQGNSSTHTPALGGGMYNDNASYPQLTDVLFTGNSAEYGGGMCNYGGSAPMLDRVTFTENDAYRGGGMYSDSSDPTLLNVLFWGNEATGTGALAGGMYNRDNAPTLVNVTFSVNLADDGSGGGMFNFNSTPQITNAILWGNTAVTSGDEIHNVSSTPAISYSLIENCGGSGGAWNPALGTDGGNNIDANPDFMDMAAGDLHIWSSSPAVEAGDNTALPAGTTLDLDGDTRIYGTYVDMGAYEVQSDPTGIGDDPASVPSGLMFHSIYPNPFNPTVTIEFELDRKGPVRLGVYDAGGRLVRILKDGIEDRGIHRITWNGRGDTDTAVTSGLYFIRLESGEKTISEKLVLLR